VSRLTFLLSQIEDFPGICLRHGCLINLWQLKIISASAGTAPPRTTATPSLIDILQTVPQSLLVPIVKLEQVHMVIAR